MLIDLHFSATSKETFKTQPAWKKQH